MSDELLPLMRFSFHPVDQPVDTNSETPNELAIFQITESQLLPEGKTFDDLTDQEKALLKNRYRFIPFKPGKYQEITGYIHSLG
jgi:hypothetical protein